MAVISSLSVSLKANTKGLTRGLTRAKKQVKSFTKSVLNVKTAIVTALGIGAAGSFINSSLDLWKTQEQAVASLEAANESMGRSTIGLTDDLRKLAASLQREGIIGDEAIIQGQAFLATYGKIPDELLPRATRAMVDLMAKTGKSGQAAANLIGKASLGLVGSLRIAGIDISETTQLAIDQQKEMERFADKAGIKLRGLGDDSKILSMILADIEGQIGGANKALAATDTGALDQLRNSIGDVQEKIGKIILSGFGKWARQLSKDIDNADFNVESLGKSFNEFLESAVLGIAPFVNAFNGISLVIKTLKLGLLGFGLLVTGVFKNAVVAAKTLSDAFGLNLISDEAERSARELFKGQLRNVAELKAEIAGIYDGLANKSFENELIGKLNEFKKRVDATQAAIDKPSVNPAVFKPSGSLDQLGINTTTTDIGVIMRDNSQIDETNKLLGDIKNGLNRGFVAVAG